MATNLEQLIDKIRALPPKKQEEALRLLDSLTSEAGSESTEQMKVANRFGKL